MRSTVLEGRKEDAHGVCPLFLFGLFLVSLHDSEIVCVSDSNVALANKNGFDLFPIVSNRRTREVVADTFEPLLRFRSAVMFEEGGEERNVVGMLAIASADASFPFRIGEFFVRNFVPIDAVFGCVGDARTSREPEPMALGVPVNCRNVLFDHGRDDRLRDSLVDSLCKPSNIDGKDDIGGRISAFKSDPFKQTLTGKQKIGFDSGFFRKSVKKRFDEEGLPVGINGDLTLFLCKRGRGNGNDG